MIKGTVQEFDLKKGFGFIYEDFMDQDYFVHYTAIMSEGFKTLKPGQNVEFQLAKGPKGYQAINVTVLD
ncbi:cold-shock protein [Holzapfeliella sp. He02]|uniref:Cold-shock protein n=1 Tax=Holzapfeliella saturejae TaxID=3082953 RepID=A0ABU8SI22_9LACO